MTLGLCSNLLAEAGFRHAFFMRLGGVSPPPWESLNFSTASGDSGDAVATNLSRAARSLEVPAERIYFLSQVHGHDHRRLDGTEDRQAMLHVEGDITVSSTPQVGCAVRMADCPAVLVAHRESGSVAAIHSGWRGTVQHAVAAGVKALRDMAGDGPLLAAVGPHIESCCFEVGADVAVEIAAASDLGDSIIDDSRAKPHVDLRRVIDAQLRSAGVGAIDHVRGCTMCDSKRFHSYRRDGKVSGRMLAVIVCPGRA
jgi:YfiH family protein